MQHYVIRRVDLHINATIRGSKYSLRYTLDRFTHKLFISIKFRLMGMNVCTAKKVVFCFTDSIWVAFTTFRVGYIYTVYLAVAQLRTSDDNVRIDAFTFFT